VPDSKFLFGANKKVAAAFAQLYVQYEMACAPAIMSNVFRLLSGHLPTKYKISYEALKKV